MSRPRILIVSYTIPEDKIGGGLLLHRHFTQKQDYEIGVVTSNPAQPSSNTGDLFLRYVPEPRWIRRLSRTRLGLWVNDYKHVIHPRLRDRRLLKAAKEFAPDLIFNVAETYLSRHALMLARKLKIPFACYFMDWANYASSQHTWVKPVMDKMYRELYKESDLALCICEGMRDELGEHPNAHVIHPLSSPVAPSQRANSMATQSYAAFKFTFAGNLAHWYGEQVGDILTEIESERRIHLDVFGAFHRWSSEFEARQRELGTYHGLRKFEELKPAFEDSNAFLLTMGFGRPAELIERTSFKTKFLDYLQYEKPVLIWGPEYCSAIQIARRFDAAYCVTDPNPAEVIKGMLSLSADQSLQKMLIQNATKMRKAMFEPSDVYSKLKTAIDELIAQAKTKPHEPAIHKQSLI